MLTITHLQRFSVHDGPGIRTTVFCKGCSLRCFWCHNPEAVEPAIRPWYSKERCIACGNCREGCPSGALSPTGRRIEQESLVKQLLGDVSHYQRTGGGITFSGGEPLLQAKELGEIMGDSALSGISRAVDTAGNVSWESFGEVLPYTDLFLYDVKCMDTERHRKGTGAGNDQIQENLERLCHTGKEIWIRIPVIPGWNDSDQEMSAIAQRLQELLTIPGCGIDRIQLLPFHRFGEEKYGRLGWEYPARELTPPSEEKMERMLGIFRETGLWKAEIGNHMVIADP